MAKLDCLGFIKSFNPENNEMVFKLSFLDDSLYGFIEESCKEQTPSRVFFSRGIVRKKTYPQLKRIWAMFKAVVLHAGEYPSKENIEAIEEYCRLNVYPRKQMSNPLLEKLCKGDVLPEEPVRLSSQTVDELGETMSNILSIWPEVFANENWYQEN